MRALVIGGSHYFGKRLVHLLIDEGAEITTLNRGQTVDDFGDKVNRIKVDRVDQNALRTAVANQTWDVIIDQICYTPQEALAACTIFEKKTKRYLMTSTKMVYHPLDGEFNEAQFNPQSQKIDVKAFQKNYAYALGKQLAEAVFAQRAPFPVALVRFPIVLGLDDYTGRLEFHVDRIKNGQEIYFPDTGAKTDFVNSADAARFLHFTAHSSFVGPINCASPDAIVLKTLMDYIEKRVGKTALYAEKATEENHSPFGIQKDNFMGVHLAESLGFKATQISKWMPELVNALTRA